MASKTRNRESIRVERILVHTMEEKERLSLVRRMFEDVQQKIFHGVSLEDYYKDIMSPDAEEVIICLYYNEADELIGFTQYMYFLCTLMGKSSVLIRTATGLLSQYRNQTTIGAAYARFLLRLYLQYPTRSIYVFSSPINPISYVTIERTLSEYWPNPRQETPQHIHQLLSQICTRFSVSYSEENPMVRNVGWKVNELSNVTFRQDDPAIQFYLKHNPNYNEGYGLMVLSPIHFKNIVAGLKRLFQKRWRVFWKPKRSVPSTP